MTKIRHSFFYKLLQR